MVYVVVGRYPKSEKSDLSLWHHFSVTASDSPRSINVILRFSPELFAIFHVFVLKKQLFARLCRPLYTTTKTQKTT